MNGLDDLRRTLDDHAARVADTDLHRRSSAVEHRVRVARRRRLGAAAAALAAVVALGATAALIPRSDDARPTPAPADTADFGIDVPRQMSSLGFTYAVSSTEEGEGSRVDLDLPASDAPRLISWATSGDNDRVTVSGAGQSEPWTTDAADFTDFTLVPAGAATTVVVTAQEGTPAVAVYEPTDERPEGYTKDGVTFREEIAGGRLIGAVVGEPGQSELQLPAVAEAQGLAVKTFCAYGPSDVSLDVDLGGEGAFSRGGTCDDLLPLDAAAAGGSELPTEPGEDVSVVLSARSGGELVVDDDIVLAVGLYALDHDPLTNPRVAPAKVVEHDGRLWQRISNERADGVAELSLTAPRGRGEILALATLSTVTDDVVDVAFGDAAPTGFGAGEGASTRQIVSAGDLVRVSTSSGEETGVFQISFYERVG